jgi:hypothetical protein
VIGAKQQPVPRGMVVHGLIMARRGSAGKGWSLFSR